MTPTAPPTTPAVFDGADGERFLDVAATLVGEALARFVRDTPITTTGDRLAAPASNQP